MNNNADVSEPKIDLADQWKSTDGFVMAIIDNTPSGICITNEFGLFEYVNSAYCAIYGYSSHELIGKHFSVVVAESNRQLLTELHDKYIAGCSEVRGEWPVQTKAGEERFVLADAVRIISSDGRPKKVTFVMDITSRKRAEEELARSENSLRNSNATKDKFFSIIAHDLRNPFQGLIMGAQLLMLESDDKSAAKTRKRGAMMLEAAQSTLNLLENLLTWARTQTESIQYRPKLVHLADAVVKAVHPLQNKAHNKNIHIYVTIPDSIIVTADKYMLNTIIMNLVSNSLKFSHSGTSVTITSHEDDNDNVTVAVCDEGVGLEAYAAERLFKVNIQQKSIGTDGEQGSGLGLLLCKEFVSKHGGKIWIESQVGKGTTFFFTLPKAQSNDLSV